MGGKYLLRTLGCKVNQYESQQLREALESCGLRPVTEGEQPDVAVVNSCAVTASASAKTRQAARRASSGGRVPVVVVGCSATADADRLRGIAGVAAVWGHDGNIVQALRGFVVHRLGAVKPNQAGTITAGGSGVTLARTGGDDESITEATGGGSQRHPDGSSNPLVNTSVAPPGVDVNAPPSMGLAITRFDGHQRAFLKLQDGCNAHCTYCIIPQLRPRLRSTPIESAVAEARALVRAGHREIVLTGIYLGAYGRETAIRRRFEETGHSPLAEVVDRIAEVEGLVRLRLSSLEPGDVNDHLLDVLAAHDCCVPHLHLPLQSGSSGVLRRMNRQYLAEDFRRMIDRVRAELDRPAISTDIVVGFPGETEADFQETLSLARYAGFCKIHAFPFSPREHTAARWKGQFVDGLTVRDRMKRLAELEAELRAAFCGGMTGSIERVLVEGDTHRPGPVHGRTDRYFEVYFEPRPANVLMPGDVVRVRIDRVSPRRVHGTLLDGSSTTVALPVLSGEDC
ncbi:MAG: MiaB/RimO family radical SAM methylthiotransferase [Phycisphaerae bacterium]